MDSTKRRRVDATTDRLGDLPDCLLHTIISSLGSRQAVQTSFLSRRWRHLWRDVPCAAVEEQEFAGDQWERFEDFADRLLTSIPPETRLDAFRLHLVSGPPDIYHRYSSATSDRWIRRGVSRFPAVVDIRAAPDCSVRWQPHRSYPNADADRPQPDFTAASFTRRLTKLPLVGVNLAAGFVEDLGRHCPALEELHVESCSMEKLSTVASPTLRSLAVIKLGRSAPCAAHLRIAAPRLASLRLEIPYDGEDCYCVAAEAAPEPEPLASLAEASIRLTETTLNWRRNRRARQERRLEFLMSMPSFLALLPNVTKLHLAGFTTTALLEEESQEFPALHSLKTLHLEECDVGLKLRTLTAILQNTLNLENLGLHHCTFTAPPAKNRRKRGQQPSRRRTSTPPVFWCNSLKSMEIKHRREDAQDIVKVLSMISEGMQAAQWRQVKTSINVVPSSTEN